VITKAILDPPGFYLHEVGKRLTLSQIILKETAFKAGGSHPDDSFLKHSFA